MRSFLIVVMLLVAGFYMVLLFVAYGQTKSDDSSSKLLAMSPWWPLYTANYNESGLKLCRIGKALIVLQVILATAWFTLYK